MSYTTKSGVSIPKRVGKVAGRMGFEPTTSSLEGWLAIRTATSAQQLERKIGVQVLRVPIGLTEEGKFFLKLIHSH